MRRPTIPFRAPLLALVLGAAPAGAGSVSLDPSAVEAGRAATVSVHGASRFCAPLVSHRAVSAQGPVLSLSAVFEDNPAADCLPGPLAFTAPFELPALPAGDYTVLFRIVPACAYAPTPCPFASLPDTGSLRVGHPLGLRTGARDAQGEDAGSAGSGDPGSSRLRPSWRGRAADLVGRRGRRAR